MAHNLMVCISPSNISSYIADLIRVQQRGFLNENNGVPQRGDMYIKILVKIPQQLTDYQRDLLKAFMESEQEQSPSNYNNTAQNEDSHLRSTTNVDNMRVSR